MSNLVTVNAYLHRDRPNERSLRVSLAGDDRRGVWVGRKWIRDTGPTGSAVLGRDRLGQKMRLRQISLTIPLWLAKEMGLMR